MKIKVLVIDDDVNFLKIAQKILRKEGIEVTVAESAGEAFSLLKGEDFSVIVTDLYMPGGLDGMDVLSYVRENMPLVPVIFLTAYAEVSKAVDAMKGGAYTFLEKARLDLDAFVTEIRKAAELFRIRHENILLKKRVEQEKGRYPIIYTSRAMESLLMEAERIAKTEETVLITGESGTGKELLARFILENSPRAHAPFVVFNAATVPENLVESQLFGHKKGAFTNAFEDFPGYVGTADGGTLFIDEIGEMPLSVQSKLLRFVQYKTYIPLGQAREKKADVRLVFATNKDLEKEAAAGNFREDLLYRISVFTLRIPPLRERPEDIPALVHYFYDLFTSKYPSQAIIPPVPEDLVERMKFYSWPGNVRELENTMLKYVLTGKLALKDGVATVSAEDEATLSFRLGTMTLEEMERAAIRKALELTGGNKTKAAKLLGISYRTILRKTED